MARNSSFTDNLLSDDEVVNKQLAKLHGGTQRFKTLARMKLSKKKFDTATRLQDMWTKEDEKSHEVKVFILDTKSLQTKEKWDELIQKGTTHLTIEDNDNKLKAISPEVSNIQTLRSFTLIWSKVKAIPDHLLQMDHLSELRFDKCTLKSIDNIQLGQALRHLDLTNAGLKTVPLEIGNLTTLVTLNLTGNQLKTLPISMANLDQLQKLKVCGNKLAVMPACIKDLKTLETLDLSQNHIVEIPDGIGNLSSLATLRMSHNNLASLPASFVNLKRLVNLYLGYNAFTEVPEQLADLSALQALNMASNGIRTIKTAPKSLKILLLDKNQLEELPPAVFECENLEVLQVANNRISEIPAQIGRLEMLRTLHAGGNPLSGIPADRRLPPQLRHLSLCDTRIKKPPAQLRRLQNLHLLDLQRTEVEESYRRVLQADDIKLLVADLTDDEPPEDGQLEENEESRGETPGPLRSLDSESKWRRDTLFPPPAREATGDRSAIVSLYPPS